LRSSDLMTHEVERRFAQAAASPGEEMPRRQARPGRASTKGGPSTKKPTGRIRDGDPTPLAARPLDEPVL
jgi:hypothetical protein